MPTRTTAPAEEPVTLEQARLHLKLTADDPTDEDSLIEDVWIPAARRHAEFCTRRSFITQGWRQLLDCFPCRIQLEMGKVQQIDSLVYRDTGGTARTISWASPSNGVQRSTDGTLVANLDADVAEISPAFGCTWPIAMPEAGAVAVNYTAGYGDAAAVPEGIKSWILLRIGMLSQNREEVVQGAVTPLPHVDGLLDPFTIVTA